MAEDLLEKGTAVAADNEYNASEIQVLEDTIKHKA